MGWGLTSEEYLRHANEEILFIPLIETREACDNINSLLEAPRLEAIFFGPADLSASMGHLGEWEGPGVANRILEIRALAEERGIASGIMSQSVEDGVRRRNEGFGLIGLGPDTGLMIRSIREALEALRG